MIFDKAFKFFFFIHDPTKNPNTNGDREKELISHAVFDLGDDVFCVIGHLCRTPFIRRKKNNEYEIFVVAIRDTTQHVRVMSHTL